MKNLIIKWELDEDTPAYGVRGVDSETVAVDDLVRWAKKKQREVRQVIARGFEELDRQERKQRAKSSEVLAAQRRFLDLLEETEPDDRVRQKIAEIRGYLNDKEVVKR